MSVLILLAASGVLGAIALAKLGLPGGFEGAVYRAISGLCLCAVLIMALGAASLGLAQVAVVAVAGIGVAWELFVMARHRPPHEPASQPWRPFQFMEYVSLAVVAGALGIALISALAPITSWDAGVAHLSLPQSYARENRIGVVDGNNYSAYPHLMHSLYTYVFSQNGENAAALVNWVFAGLACAAVYLLGARTESRRCGIIAAAILATAPIFIDQAGTVSLDLAFTCVATAALAAMVAYLDDRTPGWLLLAGFLAGSSCGIRHTGYLVCAFLSGVVVMRRTGARTDELKRFSGAAALAAAPWLFRTLVLTGNPVYPFLTRWLPDGGMPHVDVSAIGAHESIQGMSLLQYLRFPWDIVMRPYLFDGWTKSPGGLILILGLPGLLLCGWRARRLGLYSIAGGSCFYVFQRFARYMLPFFTPMMVVASVAACRLRGLRYLTSAILIAAFAYGLTLNAALIHFKFPVVFGYEDRETYLRERVERYPAFKWVNENIPPSSTILTLDVRSYYLRGRAYQNYEALKQLIGKPRNEQLNWLKAQNIKYLFYPEAYVEETPGYAQTGLLKLFVSWRTNGLNFRLLKSFDLPRPRQIGTERVEVYEIYYGE